MSMKEPLLSKFDNYEYERLNDDISSDDEAPSVGPQTLYEYTKPLKERAVGVIKSWDSRLDKAITQNLLQKKLDTIGTYIENKFKILADFVAQLDKKGFGTWYKDLAFFLVKLPLKVAFNIINLLYNLIKAICYAATHPLKSGLKIAQLLTELVHSLTNPAVWTNIGAGMLGASLGQALLIYNPLAVLIGSIVGSALIFSGISWGVIEAALIAKKGTGKEKVKQILLSHGQYLTESLLTGFVMGLITGAIQKTIQHKYRGLKDQELQSEANKFIEKNQLPQPYKIEVNSLTQEVKMYWNWETFDKIKAGWYKQSLVMPGTVQDRLMITLKPDPMGIVARSDFHSGGHWSGYKYLTKNYSSLTRTLPSLPGIVVDKYPMPTTKFELSGTSALDPIIIGTALHSKNLPSR